jgi:hypothetical protein
MGLLKDKSAIKMLSTPSNKEYVGCFNKEMSSTKHKDEV